MTSQARIDANRKNALKSSGPKTEAGKARAKLNGLKHGLRSKEVVLPSEDQGEFDSHLNAWMDDWQPASETARFLVERAATAAWRIKRVVRVERDRISTRIDQTLQKWDKAQNRDISHAVETLEFDPEKSIETLRSTREGVYRLTQLWSEIATALRTPGDWSEVMEHHNQLIYLLNIKVDETDPEKASISHDSWSLILSARTDLVEESEEELDAGFNADEAERVRVRLLEIARVEFDELVERWESMANQPARRRQAAERLAFEAIDQDKTLHSYEARLDREAKSSINLLIKLKKSGADIPEVETETPATTEPNASTPETSVETTEPNAEGSESAESQPKRDRGGRVWPVETVEQAGNEPEIIQI